MANPAGTQQPYDEYFTECLPLDIFSIEPTNLIFCLKSLEIWNHHLLITSVDAEISGLQKAFFGHLRVCQILALPLPNSYHTPESQESLRKLDSHLSQKVYKIALGDHPPSTPGEDDSNNLCCVLWCEVWWCVVVCRSPTWLSWLLIGNPALTSLGCLLRKVLFSNNWHDCWGIPYKLYIYIYIAKQLYIAHAILTNNLK